jgi:hypothetical protein
VQEASALFMIIKQQPGQGVLSALQPSIDALVDPSLLKHKDKDIQVLVASCISEILRIVAPDAPFTDETWEVRMPLSPIYFFQQSEAKYALTSSCFLNEVSRKYLN